ncbi:hypothetical protein V7183_00525, partial [Bacillus sp. JJ1127]|uniref:hypothetical protein n=1 Tax=Bacillus sp. JJ1127 TaxID=3122952 RepID=UPI003000EF67
IDKLSYKKIHFSLYHIYFTIIGLHGLLVSQYNHSKKVSQFSLEGKRTFTDSLSYAYFFVAAI